MTRPTTCPPKVPTALLALCLPRGKSRDSVLGDLHEGYVDIVESRSQGSAKPLEAVLWYWHQALLVAIHYLMHRALPARKRHRPTDSSTNKPTNKFRRSSPMKNVWQDIRFAVRMFRRTPGFTFASVSVLAIGIGAVTVMFSTLNSVALRPLPFEHPDRLVWAWGTNETRNANSMSAEDYWDYREESNTLESLGAFLLFTPRAIITGKTEPERVFSTLVSYNLFSTLGVSPQLGRSFHKDEERNGSENVVVVSNGFWQRRLGGDPEAVGTSLTINGEPHQILGVMPPDFDFPGGIEIWFPMRESDPYTQGRANNNFFYVGRLREGVTIEQAQTELSLIAARLEDAYPETNASWGIRLVSLHERYFAGARSTLTVFLGLVGLVLLIACANVASLSLARATTRSGEIAVRFSLGAGRSRVVGQLLIESLIVALAGGGLAIVVAHFGIGALKTLGPALPRLQEISIDTRVLGFTFAISLLTSVLVGIVPALKGTQLSLAQTLNVGGSRSSEYGRTAFRNGLVITQVAFSLMLMIASGLLVQSYARLQSEEAGFQTQGLLQAELQLPEWKYASFEEQEQAWAQLHETVLALPGVISVGSIDQVPIRTGGTYNEIHRADRPPTNTAERDAMFGQRRFASEDYLNTMGIPILAGRSLEPTDRLGSTKVIVISKTMADLFFQQENPLGKEMVLWGQNFQIVGVVGDVREFGLGATPPPVFYMPSRQWPQARMQLLIRTAGDPLALAGALRRAVWEIDRDIPISGLQTMESRVSRSLAGPRFSMLLVGFFAIVAVILASTGLYGVLAYFVRQRNRELGIRVALGAGPNRILGLVLKRGMLLAGTGIVVGLLGGFVGARALQSLLYNVAPTDALTFGGVSICLAVVALVACVVPASRALKVDPHEILRE
jgi:putative ABC transport system permease protein